MKKLIVLTTLFIITMTLSLAAEGKYTMINARKSLHNSPQVLVYASYDRMRKKTAETSLVFEEYDIPEGAFKEIEEAIIAGIQQIAAFSSAQTEIGRDTLVDELGVRTSTKVLEKMNAKNADYIFNIVFHGQAEIVKAADGSPIQREWMRIDAKVFEKKAMEISDLDMKDAHISFNLFTGYFNQPERLKGVKQSRKTNKIFEYFKKGMNESIEKMNTRIARFARAPEMKVTGKVTEVVMPKLKIFKPKSLIIESSETIDVSTPSTISILIKHEGDDPGTITITEDSYYTVIAEVIPEEDQGGGLYLCKISDLPKDYNAASLSELEITTGDIANNSLHSWKPPKEFIE